MPADPALISHILKKLRNSQPDDDGSVKVWHVQGEDPNPGVSGPHGEPSLGFFEGTLDQVIKKAFSIPQFVYWGAGGRITPIQIVKLD